MQPSLFQPPASYPPYLNSRLCCKIVHLATHERRANSVCNSALRNQFHEITLSDDIDKDWEKRGDISHLTGASVGVFLYHWWLACPDIVSGAMVRIKGERRS